MVSRRLSQSLMRAAAAGTLASVIALGTVTPASAFLNFFNRERQPEPAPAPVEILPEALVPQASVPQASAPRPMTGLRLPPPRPAGLAIAAAPPAALPAPAQGIAPLAIAPGAAPMPGAPQGTSPVQAVAPSAPATVAVPLPPRPPADLQRVAGLAPAAAPVVAPAAVAATPAAAPMAIAPPAPVVATPAVNTASAAPTPIRVAAPATDAEVVARANAFFNGISALSGRFVQRGSDGQRMTGTLYLHRPGRMRFAYDEPATIDVIADGRSVVVRDRRLSTQDMYSISQTPLKFLLADTIRLGQDVAVIGVERAGDEVDVLLQDRSTFTGTSQIRLTFNAAMDRLKEWRIVDGQGFETIVTLSDLNRHASLDRDLFRINYEVMHDR